MSSPVPKLHEASQEPVALHDRAMDNIRYIRETMERSGSFTHISGAGGVAMGFVALIAAGFAMTAGSDVVWLAVWFEAAALSLVIAVYSLTRKSKSEGVGLLTGPGRRFTWNVIPPLAAAAVLTFVMLRTGAIDLLPGTWLLLYGTSVVTGGSYSVRSVPLMGATFMVVGSLALVTPPSWGDAWMAAGFGGIHIVFGAIIWRKHGG